MSELRAYYYNNRDILELVRYQKKELSIAVGAEEVILNVDQMLRSEKRAKKTNGKYLDMIQHRVSNQLQKKVMFQYHIWDL